jgi:Subtilisin inhibitor-like
MVGAAAVTAALSIAVSPGDGGPTEHWTLRCAPAGGTLPKPAQACARLEALGRWYAPTPPGTMCSQIFGGPQHARVVGIYDGRRVWATFRRRNGCETARWNRVSFLFPGA